MDTKYILRTIGRRFRWTRNWF